MAFNDNNRGQKPDKATNTDTKRVHAAVSAVLQSGLVNEDVCYDRHWTNFWLLDSFSVNSWYGIESLGHFLKLEELTTCNFMKGR